MAEMSRHLSRKQQFEALQRLQVNRLKRKGRSGTAGIPDKLATMSCTRSNLEDVITGEKSGQIQLQYSGVVHFAIN
jgi:hypothetical protein